MQKVLKYASLAIAGLLILLLAWGLIEPYLIDREPHVARVPGLPAAWEGKQVAQISDWQVGMWLDNEPTIRRIVRRILEEQPALVLITGDFVYHPGRSSAREELRKVVDLLRPLGASGIPTYAVLGNHDYGVTSPKAPASEQLARAVQSALESAGVTVLRNEALPLAPPGDLQDGDSVAVGPALFLAGIGPHWPGRDKPAAALADVPDEAPRLVMMHNPDTFARIPAHSAPLAMAGHTHGGQVRLPFTPAWSWLTYVKEDRVHADGWITGYGHPGNRLYVNRGIGFGLLPLRINCMPELTLFTLRRSR